MDALGNFNGGAAQLTLCEVDRITDTFVYVDIWENPSQSSRYFSLLSCMRAWGVKKEKMREGVEMRGGAGSVFVE